MHVSHVVVDGAPDYLKSKIDAVVAPYRDAEMTLTDLRNVAVQVTQVLLDNGETISFAYVPQQDVIEDVVHLAILRGRLESVTLEKNNSLVRDRVLKAYLEGGLSPSGDVKVMQDQLGHLSDLPGMGAVTPTLSPGQTPGGSALSITAQAGPRVEGALVADNAGSQTTGRIRMGAQIGINSPLGLGDRFQVVGFASPDLLQYNHDSDGGKTLIGRISYDLPAGLRGARTGMAVSRVNYTLGGLLQDTGGGIATVYGLYGSYPLARSDTGELTAGMNVDYKRMSDTTQTVSRRVRTAKTLGFQLGGYKRGSLFGLPNALQFQAGVTGGKLQDDIDFKSLTTRGNYVKTTQTVKLTQALRQGVYLDLSANAQQASRDLDGSEKLVLGGPNAVRAYSNEVPSADSGYIASANLNVTVPKVKGLRAQVFYDYAQGKLQKFSRRDSTVILAGYGVGLNYTASGRAAVNLSYAMRTGPENLRRQNKAMVWASTFVRL